MSSILLPADYSDVSVNALQYALDWVTDGDNIDILHVQTGLLQTDESPLIQPLEQSEEISRQRLTEFLLEKLGLTALPPFCCIYVSSGEVVSSIIRATKRNNYSKIIMGTRDKYEVFDKWLGTISLGVVKLSSIPVLLVPFQCKFERFDSILVAADHHLSNPRLLGLIEEWNHPNQGQLHFIFVRSDKQSNFESTTEALVKHYFEEKEVGFYFDVSIEDGIDIGNILLDRARKVNANLILISPHKQSYISSLLFKSVSKDLILKSRIPLLFLKV